MLIPERGRGEEKKVVDSPQSSVCSILKPATGSLLLVNIKIIIPKGFNVLSPR
jgi:hypothetical protein